MMIYDFDYNQLKSAAEGFGLKFSERGDFDLNFINSPTVNFVAFTHGATTRVMRYEGAHDFKEENNYVYPEIMELIEQASKLWASFNTIILTDEQINEIENG